jgi:hypothetical protein
MASSCAKSSSVRLRRALNGFAALFVMMIVE